MKISEYANICLCFLLNRNLWDKTDRRTMKEWIEHDCMRSSIFLKKIPVSSQGFDPDVLYLYVGWSLLSQIEQTYCRIQASQMQPFLSMFQLLQTMDIFCRELLWWLLSTAEVEAEVRCIEDTTVVDLMWAIYNCRSTSIQTLRSFEAWYFRKCTME